MSGDVIDAAIQSWRTLHDGVLADVQKGSTFCPNCKGNGHEGLGLLDSDYPCRKCYGQGTL